MAVVVEQTIPFSSSALDLNNSTRWNTLFPLIRPSLKAVRSPKGNTLLVDTSLADKEQLRVAIVGRAGQISSKFLESKHVDVLVLEQSGEKTSVSEILSALRSGGSSPGPGLIIVRSGRGRKKVKVEGKAVVEIEVNGDLEVDHLIHILGTATESVK